MNTRLPPHLAAQLSDGRPPYYLHRSHPALWRGMLVIVLLLAAAALGFVIARAAAGTADFAVWALGGFTVPFLILLMRPAVWRVPVPMVADARGLHFLHGRDSSERRSVRWRDVGQMRIERHATGNGSTRIVVIDVREDSAFWQSTITRTPGSKVAPAVDRYRPLPLAPVWADPTRTLKALQHLQACAEEDGADSSRGPRTG